MSEEGVFESEAARRLAYRSSNPLSHLVNVPVTITLKSPALHQGKMTAAPWLQAVIVKWLDREGVVLEDGTFVPFGNISSISPGVT